MSIRKKWDGKKYRKLVNVMNNVNWDEWQRQIDEHNPNCPWLDDEDELTEQEKAERKADMEED